MCVSYDETPHDSEEIFSSARAIERQLTVIRIPQTSQKRRTWSHDGDVEEMSIVYNALTHTFPLNVIDNMLNASISPSITPS